MNKLNPQGRLVIEVTNSDEALLTLYENNNFHKFTYLSQNLFLFNFNTLSQLASQASVLILDEATSSLDN